MKTTLVTGTSPITKRDDITIKISIDQNGSEVFKDEYLNLTLEPQFVPQALIDLMTSMTLGETAVFDMEPEYFNLHFTEHIPAVPLTGKVQATVSIKEVSKVEDIFSDESFYFRIIEKTNEVRDPKSKRAKIHYKFEINDMTYLENLEQKPLQVMLDEQQVPELWLTIISKMRPGEHSRTECNFSSPKLSLLNNSSDEMLNLQTFRPKDSSVGYLYIKLESLDSGLYTESLEIPERNSLGLKVKDEGNNLFKSCEFEKAIQAYKSSLATLEPHADDPSVLKPSCALVMGNISLCYLRIKDFANAEKFASLALDLSPSEAKFLLRRAQAKIGNSRLDSALEDLKSASEYAGEGDLQNSIKKEIQFIKQEFAKVHQVEKERYKNLFK